MFIWCFPISISVTKSAITGWGWKLYLIAKIYTKLLSPIMIYSNSSNVIPIPWITPENQKKSTNLVGYFLY